MFVIIAGKRQHWCGNGATHDLHVDTKNIEEMFRRDINTSHCPSISIPKHLRLPQEGEGKGREGKGGNNDSRVPDRVRDGRILATHLVQWPVTIQVRGRKNVETRTIPIFALVSDEENVETNAARGDARACAHLVGIVLRQRAVVVVLKQLVGLGGVEH